MNEITEKAIKEIDALLSHESYTIEDRLIVDTHIYHGRVLTLQLFADIDDMFQRFCKRNAVKKETGWIEHFSSYLAEKIPSQSWSFSNLKKFRMINATQSLKDDYLSGNSKSKKAENKTKKTPLEKFMALMESVNKYLMDLSTETEKYTIEKNESGLFEIVVVPFEKNESTLSDKTAFEVEVIAEQKAAKKKAGLNKKQDVAATI